MLKVFLTHSGYEVECEQDIEKALERLPIERFDLVLLDEILALSRGCFILAWMREFGIDPPIIIVTDINCDELLIDWVKRGASAVINKPPRRGELCKALGKVQSAGEKH